MVSTHLKNITVVNLDHFPNFRGENKKIFFSCHHLGIDPNKKISRKTSGPRPISPYPPHRYSTRACPKAQRLQLDWCYWPGGSGSANSPHHFPKFWGDWSWGRYAPPVCEWNIYWVNPGMYNWKPGRHAFEWTKMQRNWIGPCYDLK